METVINFLETCKEYIIQPFATILELIGAGILIFYAIKAFISWLRHEDDVSIELGEGISLALEFKMGAEVLKTAIADSWGELQILAAVFGLRALMSILVHWELKQEKKDAAAKEKIE